MPTTVTLGSYTFYPNPLVSESVSSEEEEVGTTSVTRQVTSFSLEGTLLAEDFDPMMVLRLQLKDSLTTSDLLPLVFGDGRTYQVKVTGYSFDSGPWVSSINYSIDLETDPDFEGEGDAIVDGSISESRTVEYVPTDSGQKTRMMTVEYSISGSIYIINTQATTLEAQRQSIRQQLRVDDVDSVTIPVTFLGVTGRLTSMSFSEPNQDETRQEFSVSLTSEDYRTGEFTEENVSTDTAYEFFGESDNITKETITYNIEGTIYVGELDVPTDPTDLITGNSATVSYQSLSSGTIAGKLTSRSYSFNRAEQQATYSMSIQVLNLKVLRAENIDTSRTVTYIGDSDIVQKIETSKTINGTITNPDGVADPTDGLDPDIGDVTFGLPGNEVTGKYVSSGFTPTEDGTSATYQVQFSILLEKRARLTEKEERSLSITRNESQQATKSELSIRYSGQLESADGTAFTDTELQALVPFPVVLYSQNANTLYKGNPVRSAGYTLDDTGRIADWTIEAFSSQQVSDEVLPDGILEFEQSIQITPSIEKWVPQFALNVGELWQSVGYTTEKKTVSGFYIGETLADAQAAADALRNEIPVDAVPESFQQTVEPRKNRVGFSYAIANPLQT